MSHDPSIKSLIEHIEAQGEVRSAMQYQHLLSDLDIRRPEGMELVLKDEGDRAASRYQEYRTLYFCFGSKTMRNGVKRYKNCAGLPKPLPFLVK